MKAVTVSAAPRAAFCKSCCPRTFPTSEAYCKSMASQIRLCHYCLDSPDTMKMVHIADKIIAYFINDWTHPCYRSRRCLDSWLHTPTCKPHSLKDRCCSYPFILEQTVVSALHDTRALSAAGLAEHIDRTATSQAGAGPVSSHGHSLLL